MHICSLQYITWKCVALLAMNTIKLSWNQYTSRLVGNYNSADGLFVIGIFTWMDANSLMIHAHWQDSAVSVIPRWHRSGAMEHITTFVVMENKGNVQPTRNHLCINVWWWIALSELGDRIIIKMSSYQYMDPHVKDRTVSRPSYLKHGNHHIWKDGVYIETGPRVQRDNGCGCK